MKEYGTTDRHGSIRSVLLTNDDGVSAEGLGTLVGAFLRLEGTEVWVVAPDRERSASGHSISIHHPVEVSERASASPRVHVYATSGTPADCVKLALSGLLPEKPALVVSGINRGPNLGRDVFYSGTVSAALEAALSGVDGIAVSITAYERVEYEFAAEFAVTLAERVLKTEDNAGRLGKRPRLLNVNVPAVRREDVAGIAITRLELKRPSDFFVKRQDPFGRFWYWMVRETCPDYAVSDTDVYAVSRNLISITPLRLDLTDSGVFAELADLTSGLM
jgi:5'-nucleotidase